MVHSKKTLFLGLVWSSIDKVGIFAAQMLLELIMARLLMPRDYGLIGMIAVFMSVAQVFVDGGFSSALIQKKDRTNSDYSTIFYICSGLGVCIYLLLLVFSPFISTFYNENLDSLIAVLGLSLIFNSIGVVHRTKLTVDLNFKKQALFSFLSICISGVVAVILAYYQYGVWALVAQTVLLAFFNNFFLILNNKWLPELRFSSDSFKQLSGYGFKLLISGFINSLYINTNSLILGKFYDTKTVGYYTKAYQLTIFPVSFLTAVIQRVVFPYMVNFQHEDEKLFSINQKYVTLYLMVFCPVIIIALFFSRELIILLLTEKWINILIPFKYLLTSCIFFPVIIINMNLFQVKGRITEFLYIEIITKIIGISIIFLMYRRGVNYIALGVLIQFFLQFIITSVFSCKLLKRKITDQITALLPIFLSNALLFLFAEILIDHLIFKSIFFVVTYILFTYFYYRKILLEVVKTFKR